MALLLKMSFLNSKNNWPIRQARLNSYTLIWLNPRIANHLLKKPPNILEKLIYWWTMRACSILTLLRTFLKNRGRRSSLSIWALISIRLSIAFLKWSRDLGEGLLTYLQSMGWLPLWTNPLMSLLSMGLLDLPRLLHWRLQKQELHVMRFAQDGF